VEKKTVPPESKELASQTLSELIAEVPRIRNQLGVSDTCGNKSESLLSLKIEAQFISAGSNNYKTDDNKVKNRPPGLEFTSTGTGATLSHYDFIL